MQQVNTPTNRNVRVASSKLKALVCRIFVYNGLPGDHAEIAAHALVKASLRGVKGSALSMLMELLSGVLTGATFGGDVRNPFTGLDDFQGTGHFFMALKADAFMPLEQFKERLGTLAARAKAQPPAEGVDQILMPGEPEALTESERSENGIPLTPDVVASLMAEADLADISIDFT
jgi:LDH2 family malate/lactate/ureidoglycolate dehydrogenase